MIRTSSYNSLWTWNELSDFLNIGKPTLKKWVFLRRIPTIRFGRGKHGLIRFDPVEIAKWLDKYKQSGELY